METTLKTPTELAELKAPMELAELKARLEEKFGVFSSSVPMNGEWVTEEEINNKHFLMALAEIADEQIERGEYIEGTWHDI